MLVRFNLKKGKLEVKLDFLNSAHFMEYSRGMPTIPEDSFGRLLLRNTSLEEEEIQKYLDRLCNRLRQRKVRASSSIVRGKNAELYEYRRCRCMYKSCYTMFASYLPDAEYGYICKYGNHGAT